MTGLPATARQIGAYLPGRALSRTALASAALAGCVLSVAAAAPARAQSGPPGALAPAYAHTVFSDVSYGGDYRPGASLNTGYVPPQCWLEPRFTAAQSYAPGDPRSPYSPSFDADTYWWWFASAEPGMVSLLGRLQGARQRANSAFRAYLARRGWWWVPAWLGDSQGFACAQGLVASMDLNNGLLEFRPPQAGGGDTPGHPVDGAILADLARAALALPAVRIHTSPAAPARPSDVNLPTWVWVTYRGTMSPSDTASVSLPGGGTLAARVTASRPVVLLSVSSPGGTGQARIEGNCGAAGSRYTGRAGAVPPCGVTFLAPSAAGRYTLTVTVRWTVTWADSTGAAGGFPAPPYPPSVVSRSVPVTVREIQSVNG